MLVLDNILKEYNLPNEIDVENAFIEAAYDYAEDPDEMDQILSEGLINKLSYYGDTKTAKAYQKGVDALMDAVKTGNRNKITNASKAFSEIIKNGFGFGRVHFEIIDMPGMGANAFTTVNAVFIAQQVEMTLKKLSYHETPDGIRFSSDFDANIYATSALFKCGLTPREVGAIMLHEIGHNFSSAVNNYLYLARMSQLLLFAISAQTALFKFAITLVGFGSPENSASPKTKAQDLISKVKALDFKSLQGAFGTDMDVVTKYLAPAIDQLAKIPAIAKLMKKGAAAGTYIIKVIYMAFIWFFTIAWRGAYDAITLGLLKALHGVPLDAKALRLGGIISTLIGYGYVDEKVADKFATLYGYGPDLNSGLDKLVKSASGYKHNPKEHGTLDKVFNMFFYTVLYFFDPHPTNLERIVGTRDALKEALHSNKTDAKEAAQIELQLAKIDKQLEVATNLSKRLESSDEATFFDCYGIILYKIFGHSEIKGLLHNRFTTV